VAYRLTQPNTDGNWIASFFGEKPEKTERYVSRVRKRGEHPGRCPASRRPVTPLDPDRWRPHWWPAVGSREQPSAVRQVVFRYDQQ